jgi:hypothetical protein
MIINTRKVKKFKATIKQIIEFFLNLIFIKENNVRINKYFNINIKELFLIQYIFEGYERLVNITTVDKNIGLIRINCDANSQNDVKNIIEALKKDFYLEETNHYDKF